MNWLLNINNMINKVVDRWSFFILMILGSLLFITNGHPISMGIVVILLIPRIFYTMIQRKD